MLCFFAAMHALRLEACMLCLLGFYTNTRQPKYHLRIEKLKCGFVRVVESAMMVGLWLVGGGDTSSDQKYVSGAEPC